MADWIRAPTLDFDDFAVGGSTCDFPGRAVYPMKWWWLFLSEGEDLVALDGLHIG